MEWETNTQGTSSLCVHYKERLVRFQIVMRTFKLEPYDTYSIARTGSDDDDGQAAEKNIGSRVGRFHVHYR